MKSLGLVFFFSTLAMFGNDFNPQMQEYLSQLKSEAQKEDATFKEFSPTRGEKIFTSESIGKKGVKISCTSCHTTDLTQKGSHRFTNKAIKPLAPSINSSRLQDVKEVKKWLRRNFKDVYIRQGTAKEKGDVLYYINSK